MRADLRTLGGMCHVRRLFAWSSGLVVRDLNPIGPGTYGAFLTAVLLAISGVGAAVGMAGPSRSSAPATSSPAEAGNPWAIHVAQFNDARDLEATYIRRIENWCYRQPIAWTCDGADISTWQISRSPTLLPEA
jgi:hypothetical protein